MKVSAVIPTYNNEKCIKKCLDSLVNQSRKFDEILLVDSKSKDQTIEIAKSFKKVKIIEVGKGRSLARNIGWKKSKGDVIAFIESDSVYNKDWLKYILESIENGADAVIDARRVNKPKSFIANMNNEIFKIRLKKSSYKPFSAWVFKREVLEKTKGFDVNLDAAEDVDLGTRTLKAGYKIEFQPKSVQYHNGEPRSIKEILARSKWFGRYMKNYFDKYPEKFNLKRASFLFLLPLLFAINWISGIIAYLLLILIITLKSMKKGLDFKYAIANSVLSLPREYVFYVSYFLSRF